MKQLENGEANVLISRQYDARKGHGAICTGSKCPSSVSLRTFDLTTLGLPSNAQLLQSIRFMPKRALLRLLHCSSGTSRSCSHALQRAQAATTTASPKYIFPPPHTKFPCIPQPPLILLQRAPGEFTMCVRHWLEVINSCDALQAAVPGSQCVEGIQGRDLPAYRQSDNKVALSSSTCETFSRPLALQVLVNANQFTLSSSCGSSHPHTQATPPSPHSLPPPLPPITVPIHASI
jgi:hypothetical protein